jgi:hypothetical protein
VVHADNDGLKDLLIGQAEGNLKLYLNINSNDDPRFDGGTLLEVGDPGVKIAIDVGSRATPIVVDWDNDGRRDLLVGAVDGMLRLYINEGTDSSWDFRAEQIVQEDGADLVVPTLRASPHVMDLDNDDNKDLLLGNTEGQILFYRNVGTDAAPVFSGYAFVEADGAPINLDGLARSRPFVCDWNKDSFLDLLVGGSDGLVHLYRGTDEGTDADREKPPTVHIARLLPAYPNPFNPTVIIPFELTETRHIHLSVYDITGRRVAVLADRAFGEGSHQVVWQGVDNEGRPMSSGVYFTQLIVDGISSTGKIVLIH